MSAIANSPISRKLAAALAAVLAGIVVSGAVVYDRLGVLEATRTRHLQTDRIAQMLGLMMQAMLDQESALRGYLITADQSYLDTDHAFGRVGGTFAEAFGKSKALTTGNAGQERRLDELNELVKQWRGIAEREIVLMAQPGTRQDARALEQSRAGETVMHLIRAKVREIAAVESDLSDQTFALQKQAYAVVSRATILGAAGSLVVAIAMGLLLRRGVAVPIKRMTKAMAALAKGDTSITVPGIGRSDEIGAMAAAVQVFRDSMIDRQRAEGALQESEEKWRAVFENNPTMYFIVDAVGTVVSVNPFGAEQLGYTVDELTGASVLKVFHRDDREAARRNAARCFEQPGRSLTWELRKVRKNGSMLWVRETAKAMPMKERPVILIVCEDVTERKWAESLTAQVFESSPDGICLIDRDYRYQRVNRGYERTLGVPSDRILGQHVAQMLGSETFEQITKPNLDRCFAGEEISYTDWVSYPPGRRYLGVTYSPLRQGSEQVEAALVITRDLTEHMLSSEALRAAQAELAHANRVATMGQLTASIAHEVNQPIAAAVTNAHAALRWLAARPPDLKEARQALDRIVANGQRADDVIGRIRALIRKSPPRRDRFDLNEAIVETIALTRSEMQQHGISLQTTFRMGLPPLEGDRIQFQQVILNLIINAIEAMSSSDEGGRALGLATELDSSGGVLVTVRDSGPGLEPEAAERAFETFYSTKPRGMGMGLAICRSIIGAHGGRLWSSANKPHGAVFQLTLPAAPNLNAADDEPGPAVT